MGGKERTTNNLHRFILPLKTVVLHLSVWKTLGQKSQGCSGGAATEILAEITSNEKETKARTQFFWVLIASRCLPRSLAWLLTGDSESTLCDMTKEVRKSTALGSPLCLINAWRDFWKPVYGVSDDSSSDYIPTSGWNTFTASHGLQRQTLGD